MKRKESSISVDEISELFSSLWHYNGCDVTETYVTTMWRHWNPPLKNPAYATAERGRQEADNSQASSCGASSLSVIGG